MVIVVEKALIGLGRDGDLSCFIVNYLDDFSDFHTFSDLQTKRNFSSAFLAWWLNTFSKTKSLP